MTFSSLSTDVPRRRVRGPQNARRRPALTVRVFAVLGCLGAGGFFPACRKVEYVDVEVPVIQEKIVEKEKIVIEKPPLPSRSVSYSETPDDLVDLYNGIRVKTTLEKEEGERAALERKRKEAFQIEYKVNLTVPSANQSLVDLASLNERLPTILPGLEAMMSTAEVSSFYHRLYELKTELVQRYLTRLRLIPSRHNFFDCETVLEMSHPDSGQRVLLIQGEMDVVSDGSDGDRMSEYDDYIANSPYYQPFTSYGWRRRSTNPNPLLDRWEKKLEKAEKEGSGDVAKLKHEIADLKGRSFLIARKDPFMVIPTSFLGYQRRSSFAPTMGDYCVIIHEDRVFPAIIGDAGPTYKSGEASLRIAKEINEKASPYNRPVSSLTVTYVVFPQSRDTPFSPPDLAKWHQRCEDYLGRIGGLGENYSLHVWKDLFAPEDEASTTTPEPDSASVESAGEAAPSVDQGGGSTP